MIATSLPRVPRGCGRQRAQTPTASTGSSSHARRPAKSLARPSSPQGRTSQDLGVAPRDTRPDDCDYQAHRQGGRGRWRAVPEDSITPVVAHALVLKSSTDGDNFTHAGEAAATAAGGNIDLDISTAVAEEVLAGGCPSRQDARWESKPPMPNECNEIYELTFRRTEPDAGARRARPAQASRPTSKSAVARCDTCRRLCEADSLRWPHLPDHLKYAIGRKM